MTKQCRFAENVFMFSGPHKVYCLKLFLKLILIVITKVRSFKADHVDVVTPERLHAHCNAARIRKALRGREKLLL